MSKIRELMKEVAEKHMHEGLWEFHSQTSFDKFSKEVEQAIKAEIMGLNRLEVTGLVSGKSIFVIVSDLENLFKEDEL